MLVAPIVEAGAQRADRRHADHQQQGRHAVRRRSPKKAWPSCAQTLAIAFKQRQKPQRRCKTKYDYLVADAVISAGEFELALALGARKKPGHRGGADRRVPGQDPGASAQALSKFFGVPYEPFKPDRIKPPDLLKNLKREYVESNHWVPIDDTKEGLVVLCLDPERIRASRIVSNVFPKAQASSTGSRTQKRVQGHARPVLRRRRPMDSGDIGDMLSGMDDESTARRSTARQRRGLRGGGQRAGQARQQDHHRRLQPGRLRHPHRALPGQGQDRDPLPQGRLARALHRGAGELPQRDRRRASRSCATSTSRRSASRRTARSSSRSSARSTSSCAWRPSPPQGGVEDIVMRILAAGEPIPLDKLGFSDAQPGEAARAAVEQALRPVLRLRPDRLGQDHHAALGAEATSTRRTPRSGPRRTRSKSRRRACARCR